MPDADRPLTVLFMPESAYGPTNNCIGIGDVLRSRGHRVVFAAEASWEGKLTAPRLRGGPRRPRAAAPDGATAEQDAGQFWKDFIRDTAPEFRKTTIEQLETVGPADLGGADRRREVLRAAAAGDHRADRGRTSSSRTTSSRSRRWSPPACRSCGSCRATRWRCKAIRRRAGVLRLPGGRPPRVGRVPRRVRPHAPRDVVGVRRLGASSRARRRCRTSSSSTRAT